MFKEQATAQAMFLETERLVLRRFTEGDLENLLDLDSDPEVMRFLNGGVPTPRHIIENEILPRFLHYSGGCGGFGFWASIEKATAGFLGWCSFRPVKATTTDEVELGFRLRRAAWGMGYATEGSRALVGKGFTELGVQRVVATTYQDNLASRRVLEKVGLRLVRRYRITREDLLRAGTFELGSQDIWDGDDFEYALDRAEWEQTLA